jgi:hypothetical protein
MYCLYAKRANESIGPIPDCLERDAVLAAHAAELTAAGFEWVAPDATNWDGDPRGQAPDAPGSDFYQLRPTEIIADAWAAARLNGTATPQLSIFALVSPGGALWRWYMSELFNNASLLALDLIFHAAAGQRVWGEERVCVCVCVWQGRGLWSNHTPPRPTHLPRSLALIRTAGGAGGPRKKLFIAADLGPSGTDYATLGAIAANGGANDTVVPLMWFAPNASGAWEASGRLAYISRCIARHVDSGALDFSYDAWINASVPCGHLKTPASPVGSSWTVSTGLPINSVPFGAVRFNGLLTKKQWWDVLADPEPTDLIFAPSWNEFGSRAYPLRAKTNATNPAFYAVGAAPDDADRYVLFEDGYGVQRSRSIEPSVEDGGRFYAVFASCVRVYRVQAALGIVGNGMGCSVAGEECCTLAADEHFAHVWSLDRPPSASETTAAGAPAAATTVADSLLTADARELGALEASGWIPLCVPTVFGRGPTATCVDPNLPFDASAAGIDKASRGPFVLFSNTSFSLPDTVPLVRCTQLQSSGLHAITNATDGCALISPSFSFDGVLGFGRPTPDSLFARPVRRCHRTAAPPRWYTAVNNPCLDGDVDEGLLLYAV